MTLTQASLTILKSKDADRQKHRSFYVADSPQKGGEKGKPSYRIVVAESRAPRDGAYLEWIGNYDPMTDPPSVTLKTDRATEWLSKGAQPSDAVKRILHWNGILEREPLQRTDQRQSEAGGTAPAQAIPTAVAEAAAEESEDAVVEDAPAEEPVDEQPEEEEPGEEAAGGDDGGDSADSDSGEDSQV